MFLIIYKIKLWSCLLELLCILIKPTEAVLKGSGLYILLQVDQPPVYQRQGAVIFQITFFFFAELGVEGRKPENQVHKVHAFPSSCSLFWLFGSCSLFALRFDPGDGKNTRKINTFLTVSWASLLFSFLLTASPPSPSTPKAPSWQHPCHFKTAQHILFTYSCLFQ